MIEKIRNIKGTKDILPEEIIRLFMIDFYSKAIHIPNNILVSHMPRSGRSINRYSRKKSGIFRKKWPNSEILIREKTFGELLLLYVIR